LARSGDLGASEYDLANNRSEPAYDRIREAFIANALGAVVSLTRGDTLEAEIRLLENAVIAYRLTRDARLFTTRYAMGILQGLALLPLSRLDEARGDTASAEHLRASVDRLRELAFHPVWATGLAGFVSDPGSVRYWSDVLDNASIPFGLRVAALEGAWSGLCVNPREIVRGPSPRRIAIARDAAARLDARRPTSISDHFEAWWQLELGEPGLWPLRAWRYCRRLFGQETG
jgi:hypothetical protein